MFFDDQVNYPAESCRASLGYFLACSDEGGEAGSCMRGSRVALLKSFHAGLSPAHAHAALGAAGRACNRLARPRCAVPPPLPPAGDQQGLAAELEAWSAHLLVSAHGLQLAIFPPGTCLAADLPHCGEEGAHGGCFEWGQPGWAGGSTPARADAPRAALHKPPPPTCL